MPVQNNNRPSLNGPLPIRKDEGKPTPATPSSTALAVAGPAIAAGEKSLAEQLAEAKALNAQLQAKAKAAEDALASRFSMKVGDKGGIVVSHGASFPTTLYQEQWVRLLARKDDILAFIAANQGNPLLKRKGVDRDPQVEAEAAKRIAEAEAKAQAKAQAKADAKAKAAATETVLADG